MRVLAILTALLIGTLSGCATVTVQSTYVSKDQPLPAGSGLVAMQVINNADRLAPLHKGWTSILAIRVDNMDAIKQTAIEKAKATAAAKGKTIDEDKVDWDPELYSFYPMYEGTIDSQMFIGTMPEGEYIIAALKSMYYGGDVTSWISMPVYYAAGKFSVKPATFTDLGSILFQPLLSIKESSFWSNQSSTKAYVTRVFEKEDLAKIVLNHYPVIQQQVQGKASVGWIDDELDGLRQQLSQLSRQNALASSPLIFPLSGKRALAAKFGMISVLENDHWNNHNLPTNSQLYSALESDQNIAVGGELGQVFVSNDWQKWQLTRPVGADEAVVWFGETQTAKYALTSSAKHYQIYRFQHLEDKWLPVGNFVKKDPNDWLVQNGGLFVFITKNKTLRVFNDNKRYDFDETQNTWSNAKSTSLKNMVQLQDGTLVAVEVSQWDGVGAQLISQDDGINWQSINRNLSLFGDNKADVSLPAITTDGHVVTLSRAKAAGAKYSTLMIATNSVNDVNNAKSWQTHSPAKEKCESLLPQLTSGTRIYFLCDQGQVVSTDDYGKTWQTDIDRDIPEMQKQFDSFVEQLKKQKNEESTSTTSAGAK